MSFEWDFFIAHAGADLASAEERYGYLSGRARVFLDEEQLLLGDDWGAQLPEAQRAALITLVLVSSGTERAYYEREEIAAAIELGRRSKNGHRFIPIYLDQEADIPFGLRLMHSLRLSSELSMTDAATRLLDELPRVKALAGDALAPCPEPPARPACEQAHAQRRGRYEPERRRRQSRRRAHAGVRVCVGRLRHHRGEPADGLPGHD
jgi:hypothetical protein